MMTLFALRDAGLPLPALAIGICPWMDIGRRGQRPLENDRYDWVQEHMALKFGYWLKGNTGLSDTDLSPICGDLRGLCPIYLQAGGKEVLFDMIRDFALVAKEQGAQVTLDVWPSMNHDFQAYGTWLPESHDALRRIGAVVEHYCGNDSE